jgi:transposase
MRTLVPLEANPVAIGIDAAVVANHHVVVRRSSTSGAGETLEDLVVPPTLAGMEILTERAFAMAGVMAVAEPTSMTWLALAVALRNAGGDLALVGHRHSARLRSALAGKNKSDPIDAVVLSRAGELFALQPAQIPSPGELALRRAAQRRGKVLVEANRCLRRVISQARWAFPDVWNAFAGSRETALAVLARWPHLENFGRARTSSITEVVALHTRGVAHVEARAERIRTAARSWPEFWTGHLDLDALAWETTELLADLSTAEARLERASEQMRQHWEQLWGDDPLLLSVPGMGPIIAPTVRAFLADGTQFENGVAIAGDHQGRPVRAPARLLLGSQCRSLPRSPTRRLLQAPYGGARPLPRQSQLCRSEKARREDLGDSRERPALSTTRSRGSSGQRPSSQGDRRVACCPHNCSPPDPRSLGSDPQGTTHSLKPD